MLRLGIIDFDSSHCIEYTRRFNHLQLASDQFVEGARVVAGWPGTSRMAPERIPGFREQMVAAGIPLVDSPEQLIGRVDAVLVLSLCGAAHLERARPFLRAGIPVYVDKPFTCSLADARALLQLVRETGTLLTYGSALRWAEEVLEFQSQRGRLGDLLGLVSYGPAKRAGGNPGLFHYGIHAIEVLYALMGTGCTEVTAAATDGADVVTGRWSDGRLATMRGSRRGASAYGFVAFCEHGVIRRHVSTYYAYRNLCREIVRGFSCGVPTVGYDEIEELIRFLTAAGASERDGGRPVALGAADGGP